MVNRVALAAFSNGACGEGTTRETMGYRKGAGTGAGFNATTKPSVALLS